VRIFTLFLVVTLTSGCISSSYLASVGARAKHGQVTPEHDNIRFLDSKMVPGGWALMHGAPPYSNLIPEEDGELVAEVPINFQEIKWASWNTGYITIDVNGEPLDFEVKKEADNLTFTHQYRHWYGYPAQALIVVTIPLDIAIIAVGAVVGVIAMPFVD
jgi:hypothetical protein